MCPDRRRHRGAHPSDNDLFDPSKLPVIRQAVAELSWLVGRGYAAKSALKLVGDRHSLTERQRIAISRAACADWQRERRRATLIDQSAVAGKEVAIDGFNLIITVEAALSGGVIARCRDGCLRDLSSVHGSYRSVEETERAIELIGEALELFNPASVMWYLDRPVSNSGRLARRIVEMASLNNWPWTVEVVFNPDAALIDSRKVAITSDSMILDRVEGWVDLTGFLVRRRVEGAWVVDLRESIECGV